MHLELHQVHLRPVVLPTGCSRRSTVRVGRAAAAAVGDIMLRGRRRALGGVASEQLRLLLVVLADLLLEQPLRRGRVPQCRARSITGVLSATTSALFRPRHAEASVATQAWRRLQHPPGAVGMAAGCALHPALAPALLPVLTLGMAWSRPLAMQTDHVRAAGAVDTNAGQPIVPAAVAERACVGGAAGAKRVQRQALPVVQLVAEGAEHTQLCVTLCEGDALERFWCLCDAIQGVYTPWLFATKE